MIIRAIVCAMSLAARLESQMDRFLNLFKIRVLHLRDMLDKNAQLDNYTLQIKGFL